MQLAGKGWIGRDLGIEFMRGVKFAWSLLAATGAVGAAGAASASTTVTENISLGTSSQAITLAGASSPQFDYTTHLDGPFATSKLSANGSNEIGGWSWTPSLSGQGQTFSSKDAKVGFNIPFVYSNPGDYLHLKFEGAGNVEYFGYATFDGAENLVSITYGVPEPASWALLIAGIGLTGAAMRRRRRGALAAVAA